MFCSLCFSELDAGPGHALEHYACGECDDLVEEMDRRDAERDELAAVGALFLLVDVEEVIR